MDKTTNLYQLSQDVLAHADIVEVISSRIKVKKMGRNYEAICPFHNDTNPSLKISQDKQIFRCFVCNKGGNAIRFIEKYDKISYIDALKEVARISGYHNEELEKNLNFNKKNNEYSQILSCLSSITSFYEASLFQNKEGEIALNYLKNRHLDEETIKYFNIGYSTKDGENVINFLKAKNFSIKTIERTGIGYLKNSLSIKDSNAGRVIFPLKDRNGDVVGFSARKLSDEIEGPKYINTSETEVFNKGTILYNLFNAKEEAKHLGYIYLLEGFMDVIALHRININNAVALMGTALTNDHLKELAKLNVEIRICLDLDSAGQENTFNIINKFDELELNYKIVNPNVDFKEKDSDEILNKFGEEKLKSYLSNLLEKSEWLLSYYSKLLDLNTSRDKKELIRKIMPEILKLDSLYDVEDFINKLSVLTNFSKELIYEHYKKLKARQNIKTIHEDTNYFLNRDELEITGIKSKIDRQQFQIVSYMLENKDAVEVFSKVSIYLPTIKYRTIAKLLVQYLETLNNEDDKFQVDHFINYINLETEVEDKEQLINFITGIYMSDKKMFPPYNKKIMESLMDSLKITREKEKEKNKYLEALNNCTTEKERIEKTNEYIKNKYNKNID